jgi:hypothetical protein
MIKTVQQTVTAGTYTAGNAVGGKITLSDLCPAGTEYKKALVDVVLLDKAAQAAAYDLVFFDSDLAGTVTDKAAYAINAADLPKCLGHVSLASASAFGAAGGIVSLSNIYKRLTLTGPNAYAVLVARGAPTYASTSDVSLRFTFEDVSV